MNKINVEGDIRQGSLNVSLVDSNKTLIDWRKLDGINQADLITTFDAMRYVDISQLPTVFSNWKRALSSSGRVRFSFICGERLSLLVSSGDFDLQTTHNLSMHNNIFSVKDIMDALDKSGFIIDTVSIDKLWANIEAKVS